LNQQQQEDKKNDEQNP